jgi:hypothetical protein
MAEQSPQETAKFERLRRRGIDHYRALASIQLAHAYARTQLDHGDSLTPAILSALHSSSVIAYCRPFSTANTKRGKTWYPVRDLKREREFDTRLHDHLLTLRNKIVAHSDYDLLRSTMYFYVAGNSDELPIGVGMNVKRLMGIGSVPLLERYVKHFAMCQRRISETFDSEFNALCRMVRDDPSLFAPTLPREKIEGGTEQVLEPLPRPSGAAGDVREPDFPAEFDGYRYERLSHQRALIKTGTYSVKADGNDSDLFFEIRGPSIDGPRPVEIDLSNAIPPTANAVTLTIHISPSSGAILVSSPKTKSPIRFAGPVDTKKIPIFGQRIYLERIDGTTEYQVELNGWTDNL